MFPSLTGHAAVVVATSQAYDPASPVNNDPAQAPYTLQPGSLIAGKDVSLDFGLFGNDHNTKTIASASMVQIEGPSTQGNPDPGEFYWKGHVGALTNGAALIGATDESDSPNGTGNMFSPSNPDNITYTIDYDLGGSFDVNRITTHARHTDGRTDQKYSIYVKSGGNPFTLVPGSLVNFPVDRSSGLFSTTQLTSQVNIDFSGGDVLTGITAVRFSIDNTTSQGFNTTYFSELQVFAVPEPASLGFLGLAATAWLRRRRS